MKTLEQITEYYQEIKDSTKQDFFGVIVSFLSGYVEETTPGLVGNVKIKRPKTEDESHKSVIALIEKYGSFMLSNPTHQYTEMYKDEMYVILWVAEAIEIYGDPRQGEFFDWLEEYLKSHELSILPYIKI